MSEELDALKYLDEHNLSWHDNPTKEKVAIIEDALKRLNEYEKILNDYGLNLADFREVCFLLAMFHGEGIRNIEKKCKALEIIQRSPSNVLCIFEEYEEWEYYKEDCDYENVSYEPINNKEEFDLMKQILIYDRRVYEK